MRLPLFNAIAPDFKNVFESIPGLYLILSPELRIVAVSDAYLRATKTKRADITGHGIFDIFTDNTANAEATGVTNLRASLHRVLDTEAPDAMAVQKYDIALPESEGGGFEERYWSPLNSPVFDEKRQLVYIIHRVEDVTEFVRLKQQDTQLHKLTEELQTRTGQMENEIFKRAQQLQHANQKLREAERSQNEFFANISHELRTPLSLILAPLESLLQGSAGEITDVQEPLLQTMHNNVVRLLQMINGLLDFARYEAGKMKAEPEPTDIGALIHSILDDFDASMHRKNISFTRGIKIGSAYVLMDRYLLERILFNLLSNAVKFTSEGGSVSVQVADEAGKIRIDVADTGIGIAGEDMGNLFQKFKQVQGSSTRRFEGTGLGLAMVREFSEMLGGSVSLESRIGEGTTFTVRLPLLPTDEVPHTPGERIGRASLIPRYHNFVVDPARGNEDMSPLKLLICEDNEELKSYIVSLLHDFCRIRTAADGEEGMALVHSWSPDLVLTDVMMPHKDGITMCTEIKSNPDTAHITVVLLTALTHSEAMKRGWEARADEYLFKPFHPEELVTRIRSLLSITAERKNHLKIMEEKNSDLAQAYTELETFTYSVSHDLRSPLRVINGFSKILIEEHAGAMADEGLLYLHMIKRNTQSMGKLIDDLLEFFRLGRLKPSTVSFDMNHLVNDVIEHLKYGEATGHTGSKIILHDLPSSNCDPGLIRQVWYNLISNAFKYSRKKDAPVIEIGSSRQNDLIVYYVRDNGAGFDMKYYKKLFRVFERLHSVSEFEGTGVGLALVQKIVNKHRGTVWAEGKPDEGATFYFSLPAAMGNAGTVNASDAVSVHGER